MPQLCWVLLMLIMLPWWDRAAPKLLGGRQQRSLRCAQGRSGRGFVPAKTAQAACCDHLGQSLGGIRGGWCCKKTQQAATRHDVCGFPSSPACPPCRFLLQNCAQATRLNAAAGLNSVQWRSNVFAEGKAFKRELSAHLTPRTFHCRWGGRKV